MTAPQRPWLTVIGLGEDGPDGLCEASRAALAAAEIVMGPPRHLGLVAGAAPGAARIPWPVPFADGWALLDGCRGRATAVLASGDPFWFGAGAAVARRYGRAEWRAFPGRSAFALAAAEMGWALEGAVCLGLHAAPLTRLRPHLAPGARIIALLRGADAAAPLGALLGAAGFGDSRVTLLSALGGPRARRIDAAAAECADAPPHPLCAAIEVRGPAAPLGLVPGRPDDAFVHDGQITKAPIRAMTLAALAPRIGERLWDVGGGSGAVGIEWLLAHPSLEAVAIEARADRAAAIRANADRMGVDRLHVATGRAPGALAGLPTPDAVFIGGGASAAVIDAVRAAAPRARIVANAVTLETEALLTGLHARWGGALTRMELSRAAPLGGSRAWKAAYPLVQWSFAP